MGYLKKKKKFIEVYLRCQKVHPFQVYDSNFTKWYNHQHRSVLEHFHTYTPVRPPTSIYP